jgi:signal transduction histidine kinase
MWRRGVVVILVGGAVTITTIVLTLRTDYTDFDPKATIPAIVGITGAVVTFLAAVLVVIGGLAEKRATEQAAEMTRTLQEREHDLLQSNRELERFATIAAHDLQEPLRTILTFTSLIERKHGATMEGEALDYLLRVQAAGQRMRALIEDLLIYARIGQAERQFEVVDLNVVAREAIANVEPLLLESEGRIEIGELPTVRGNPRALTQLFTNLFANALKYRLSDPVVTVGAHLRNDEWVIGVSDNGKGIDPANHTKIFELFRRLEPGGGQAGTGLGLAICGRVVDVHGGRIWVKSTVGQGATFSFTLPVLPERKRTRRDTL